MRQIAAEEDYFNINGRKTFLRGTLECAVWPHQGAAPGDGDPVDAFVQKKGECIVGAYGNHPSFCMLATGNEAAGESMDDYLRQWLRSWQARDDRRLYTGASHRQGCRRCATRRISNRSCVHRAWPALSFCSCTIFPDREPRWSAFSMRFGSKKDIFCPKNFAAFAM